MAYRAPAICTYPGCGLKVKKGPRCNKHKRSAKREIDRRRPSARQRGYSWRWEKRRACYLREHPLCVACEKEGMVTASTVVDHIVDHKGDPGLFWDESNWQALCKPHHDRKTALAAFHGGGGSEKLAG